MRRDFAVRERDERDQWHIVTTERSFEPARGRRIGSVGEGVGIRSSGMQRICNAMPIPILLHSPLTKLSADFIPT